MQTHEINQDARACRDGIYNPTTQYLGSGRTQRVARTVYNQSDHRQMAYVPPRGPCSQKTSMLSSCPCYRFMIHPIKAPTSFDCDGCGHHASFHRMENREEEEIAKKWHTQGQERAVQSRIEGVERFEEIVEVQLDSLPPKRRRLAPASETVVDLEAGDDRTKATTGRKKRGRTER